MANKRQLSVIFVDSNKIQFYGRELKNILEVNLSSDIVSDLEVIDPAKLGLLVDNLFSTNNLKDLEFDSVLVFSTKTTFDKDLEEGDSKFKYDQTQKFLDIVPFEDMITNSYKIGKKTKIVAVNKSLYDNIRDNFERNKAFIMLVVPMSVLIETYPNLSNSADLAFIASKVESIKQFSLTGFAGSKLEGEVKNSMGIKKKDRRLYSLLAAMGILFLVLLYMVYSTFIVKPKPVVKNLPIIKTVSVTPTPTTLIATDSGAFQSTSSSKLQ